MYRYKYHILFISVFIILMGCSKKPDFGDSPQLSNATLSKSSLQQANSSTDTFNDSLFIQFNFEDGDGDIGGSKVIQVIDNRSGFVNFYGTPVVPPQGSGNGVQGTVRLLFYTTCCNFEDIDCQSIPGVSQDLSFDIILTDNAGNASNVLTTETISLICN